MKIGAKLVLARLPVSYRSWSRLSLFKHGRMDDPAYAFGVFRRHHEHVKPAPGFVALELGPGDTLCSLLVARAFGASQVYLVDTGAFAREDLAPYRAMAAFLRAQGFPDPGIEDCRTLEEILQRCGGVYATEGVESLRSLPDAGVDFVWSHAVLEHVRRRDFLALHREIRRVLRRDGACSHRVDLNDHLQLGLNNLRFPEWFWENDLVARSGFYTNRVRPGEMTALFAEAGFATELVRVDRWETIPTPRVSLAEPFRSLPDEDLLVSGFDAVLRPEIASPIVAG